MSNKFRMILTSEELKRMGCNTNGIYVDVHKLSVPQAEKLVHNIGSLMNKGDCLTVVHGYNHGTAIKDSIRVAKLFKKAYNIVEDPDNEGRTIIRFI